MKLKNSFRISISFLCFLSMTFAQGKTVMLVLGSGNLKTLNNRTEVASRLYFSRPIDKIIVSGGCGAHGSSICEATIMQEGLVRNGVERNKIYKEENAKTTVQNYVFSRQLKDQNGDRIIQHGDTVFVVSDHWHAISVAARLTKYDHVDGRFFIEGAIEPKENDKLDYVSIFNGEEDNNTFIRKALWITPQISWFEGNSSFYLMDGQVYEVNDTKTVINQMSSESIFPLAFMDQEEPSNSVIDFDSYWLFHDGSNFHKIDKKTKKLLAKTRWEDLFVGFPDYPKIQGFNTGIVSGDKLLLFGNDYVLEAKNKKGKFHFVKEGVAKDFISEWPFSWGDSNVSGTGRASDGNSIYLYRNRELLILNKEFQVIDKPKQVAVNWVNNNK